MSNRRETGAKGAAAEASKAAKVRRGCWAAGEYVADCHESGELSLVKGGIAALHIFLQIDREFF